MDQPLDTSYISMEFCEDVAEQVGLDVGHAGLKGAERELKGKGAKR